MSDVTEAIMAEDTIQILLTCGGHSRLASTSKGKRGSDIKTLSRQVFEDLNLTEVDVRYFDSEWDTWIDVTDDFTLQKKEKFIVEQHLTSPLDESETESTKLSALVKNLKGAIVHGKKDFDQAAERKQKALIKIAIGWQHFNEQRRCYTQVKSQSGGGVIFAQFPRTARYEDVMTHAKMLFFPSGKSFRHGDADNYQFKLANSRGIAVTESEFCLGTLHADGGSRTKLYLLSKKKGVDECQTIKSDSSSSDDELLNPFLSGLLQDDIPGPSDACSSGTPTVQFHASNIRNHCQICMDGEKNKFFIPCGHAVCGQCGDRIYNGDRKCPFCKSCVDKQGTLF